MSSQLASNNVYSILCPEKLDNKLNSINTTERVRDIRRTLQLLREVWLKVGLEKLKSHEEIAVKVLLDSGATDLFINTAFAKEKGFKIEKLKKPLLVRNVDGMANAGGAITHQVECNMFFKEHMERAKMDICNLENVTNFIRTITPGILDRFRRSKWPPKALKKTFQTVLKTFQRDQYSLSYQQISQ